MGLASLDLASAFIIQDLVSMLSLFESKFELCGFRRNTIGERRGQNCGTDHCIGYLVLLVVVGRGYSALVVSSFVVYRSLKTAVSSPLILPCVLVGGSHTHASAKTGLLVDSKISQLFCLAKHLS